MNNLLNNNLDYYSLCIFGTFSVCLISYFVIKSSFYNNIAETPNSPLTFNFNLEQLKEVQDILDKGDELDKQTKDKLDQDFKNILGEENYNEFLEESNKLQDELFDNLNDIFENIDLFL
uniref:Transmembrane protein n=1 Tax=Lactifluus volemus TaxID=71967 RepID=A0A2Z4M8R8_9AGAM|nr:hypothetical protein [Lactifluus volemus]AWX52883.1 hypothetical protein [Lactifluus volemus]